MLQKSYIAKVFAQDGTTLRTNFTTDHPNDSTLPFLKEAPTFQSRLNGGLGECVLDINFPFDAFNEGTSIDFMNIVDLYCYDSNNPRGRRIYRGFISKYEPYIQGGSEGVRVTLLGLASLLTFSYYKSGASFTVTHSAQDPETIARAIIDHFNTVYGGSLITYTGASTDPVGTNVSITFNDQKWLDALKKVGNLADDSWWWKIDQNGLFWLNAKPSTPTHTFTIGKDIASLVCPKDSERVVNDIQVRYASAGTFDANDASSQTEFGTGSPTTGKRTEIISESSIGDAGAAQQRAEKRLAEAKDAKIKATLVITPDYDLESISVGQTCSIRNYKKGNTFFAENMMIAALTYSADSCTLELQDQPADFGVELQQFVNG